MNKPDIKPDIDDAYDMNIYCYQRQLEQDKQEYLQFSNKPLSWGEIDYEEARKKARKAHAELIKTIFDKEE